MANYKTNITVQTLRDTAALAFVFGVAAGFVLGYAVKVFFV